MFHYESVYVKQRKLIELEIMIACRISLFYSVYDAKKHANDLGVPYSKCPSGLPSPEHH